MLTAFLILLVGIGTIGVVISFIKSNEKCNEYYEQLNAMNKLQEVQSMQESINAKATTNRERFAELRKTMNIKEVMKEMNISRTTAYRYEKWRKNKGETL